MLSSAVKNPAGFFQHDLNRSCWKSSKIKTYRGSYYEDPYIRGFLRDYFLRPSCHQCHFTSVKRCSDFTIADWWGYKRRDWKDKDFACKGVSLILANTDRALRLLPVIKMQLRERTIDEAKRTNISLSHPFPMKEKPQNFLVWLQKNGFLGYCKEMDDARKS